MLLKLTVSVFLSGLISSCASDRYKASPLLSWNLINQTHFRSDVHLALRVKVLQPIALTLPKTPEITSDISRTVHRALARPRTQLQLRAPSGTHSLLSHTNTPVQGNEPANHLNAPWRLRNDVISYWRRIAVSVVQINTLLGGSKSTFVQNLGI